MQQHDPKINPGTFVTCIYNPDKALCHPSKDAETTPAVGGCQPLHCSNVALTTDNIDALRTEQNKLDAALGLPEALPPLVQHRLDTRDAQITEFLDRHDPEPS